MSQKILLFIAALSGFLLNTANAQNIRLSGYVVNAITNEKLIGSTVFDLNTMNGVTTNEYGFFSIKTNGLYKIRISFVGYETQFIEGVLSSDTVITVQLNEGLKLEEMVVSATQNQSFEDGISIMKLKLEMIKSLPALLGESDVLKAIQLQPGTQPGREGSSGFSVRGGGSDQNLFLLDGIPVYNVNHLFGFFSVFSPYAINSATYIKGSMPARYGGRLSSVIDLRLKEGNNEQLKGELTVGIIASSFAIDGPIIKDKCSFVLTARRTYLDLFSRPISLIAIGEEAGYFFQDFTFKTNYVINPKNKLFLSAYGGKDNAFMNYRDKDDVSVYKSKFGLGWGNKILSFRWNSVWGNSMFSNVTLYYSNYKYTNQYVEEEHNIKPDSLIQQRALTFFDDVNDMGFKWDLDFYASNTLHFKTGIDAISHSYTPGATDFIEFDASSDLKSELGSEMSNLELSAYLEADYSPLPKLSFNLGVRGTSAFFTPYVQPIFQPRLSVRYAFNDRLSFSGAYDVNAQYIHLVSNSSYGAPTDLWLPVMAGIPPQRSEQFSIGGNYKISKGLFLGVDVYTKTMSNLLEFKPTEIIDHNVVSWPDVILKGNGEAKGIEFMLEKNTGKLTGWIAYTLSKSDRTFEAINEGNVFPFRYDRRHNISVVGTYKINSDQVITASWVYTSGYYMTLNYNSYIINIDGYNYLIHNYAERNNFQTPAYHRLDLSYSMSKQKKKGVRTWTFGLYNSYNKINPFMVYYSSPTEEEILNDEQTYNAKLIVKGLFPIIPSVSYSFVF